MQRHMQNISFIAILGVLLSCSFFFSQLTNFGGENIINTESKINAGDPIEAVPSCTDELTGEERISCLEKNVEISQQRLEEKINNLLAQETESERRIAIVESQNEWEESRDADCSMIFVMTSGEQEDQIDQLVCLRDYNLERIESMDDKLCQWYDMPYCLDDDTTLEVSQ